MLVRTGRNKPAAIAYQFLRETYTFRDSAAACSGQVIGTVGDARMQ
jgi:hypothetical protein